MKIVITGSSGFVGKNIIPFLLLRHSIEHIKLDSLINVSLNPSFCKINCVIHLAGKAHDLKKVSSSDDYYKVNTDLTKDIFDVFLASNAKVFITFSSVKAVADEFIGELSEDTTPNPKTHYGKSKLLSEQYILSKPFPNEKRVYILRPCMIHGPGNKGNLNLLYSIVSKGIPWPLGAFDNKRSFCSIDNLCFIINELIENEKIPSGVYNIADDEPISTNEIINLISVGLGKKPHIWNIPKLLIKFLSKLGDMFNLPLNSERLHKLTETYIVSNNKIINAIDKALSISAKDGLIKTFNSFKL